MVFFQKKGRKLFASLTLLLKNMKKMLLYFVDKIMFHSV